MEDVIHIPAGERGAIRLFALDMRPEQATFLREPGALAQVLGLEEIDLDHVEVFPISDLEELGLAGYLSEGLGIPTEQLTQDSEQLSALDGYVLLIRSRAFSGAETRLTPASQLRLIGTYGEIQTNWSTKPMETDSAKPYSAPRLSPRAARSEARRIGATLFTIVMAIIAVVILLAVF